MQYYKQTQLETMASEKAAAEFQLEKEVKRLQEAQVRCQIYLQFMTFARYLKIKILSLYLVDSGRGRKKQSSSTSINNLGRRF